MRKVERMPDQTEKVYYKIPLGRNILVETFKDGRRVERATLKFSTPEEADEHFNQIAA